MAQTKPCTIDNCDRPIKAKGWCSTHYGRWRRHGDPQAPARIKRPVGLSIKEAFEYTPITPDENGCWLWPHGTTKDGYSSFAAEGGCHYGHITSYRLYVGEIPAGMEVDHRCRVRRCVNPEHLRLATRAQNAQNQGVRKDSTTGVRGVRLLPSGRYQARVRLNGVFVFDQRFDTLEEAEAAVIEARQEFYTHSVENLPTATRLAKAS